MTSSSYFKRDSKVKIFDRSWQSLSFENHESFVIAIYLLQTD